MEINIDQTLNDRGKRYGAFDAHAEITQKLKRVIADHHTSGGMLADDQQEALDMICHKIGRIVNGDPNYVDSWVDIAGYAKLVADRLATEQETKRAMEKAVSKDRGTCHPTVIFDGSRPFPPVTDYADAEQMR